MEAEQGADRIDWPAGPMAAYILAELVRTGRYPEVRAIAAAMGVSRQTVGRHMAAVEKRIAAMMQRLRAA